MFLPPLTPPRSRPKWVCFLAGAFTPLKGDLKGFWSITITGNWRVIFRFEDGDAFDVDLVDYH